MELRVLRYFLTVAREEGINRAAEVLHITQPTLSRQLAQLEEELGVQLIHRGSRKITLTNEGILLRRRAEEILSLVDRTEKELVEEEETVEGTIAMGMGELMAVQELSEQIALFGKRYPLVQYDLLTANADYVKDQMEKGLVDIGLLLEPVDMTKFDFIRLPKKERWVVLMRADDPLAAKEEVSVEDLRSLPLIIPRRANVQSELSSWFGDTYDQLSIRFMSNLSTNAALMVQKGLGYALVIEGSVPYWDPSYIVRRPLAPELTASCVIAWKKHQPFSLAVTKWIEFLKTSLQR